jgi:hypothetical protein
MFLVFGRLYMYIFGLGEQFLSLFALGWRPDGDMYIDLEKLSFIPIALSFLQQY